MEIGATVCEVVESRSPLRAVGDQVLSYSGWRTHAVADARHTRLLDPAAAPVSTALGVLGNDTDTDGDSLTASLVPESGPSHGDLTLNANAFLYID